MSVYMLGACLRVGGQYDEAICDRTRDAHLSDPRSPQTSGPAYCLLDVKCIVVFQHRKEQTA